jgi:hypothetical protein
MANVKISQLPLATSPLDSAVEMPVVQGGVTKRAPVNTIGFLQTATGAVLRTSQSKMSDLLTVTDFGAVGDGVTNDTTAITAADVATGKKYSPKGVFDTTINVLDFDGPFFGDGQIRTSADNLLAPWFSHIKAPPTSFGDYNSILTTFNGDFSKNQIAMGHWVSGATTLGQPATGYLYRPEAMPFFGYLYNQSGHNESTSSNDGRTGVAFHRVVTYNAGQGDVVCFNGSSFVTGSKPGATDFLANPAAVLFNGDASAGSSGVYLNPYEIALKDNGFDVACVGHVMNMNRTVATGALNVWWGGFRTQSTGSAAVDNIFSAVGKFNTGIDLAMPNLDFGANQAAISLKQNQRIYLNNASSNDKYSTTFNGDYIAYSSGISGILFVVGGTASLQVTSSQVTTTVPTVAPGLRVNAATATASAGQLAFGTTTAATATAGAAGALPLQVLGYLVANLGGTAIKIPYYAN